MEIYSTNNLIEVVRRERPAGTFLRERYLPTGPQDIFHTPKVFIERADDGNLAAPFVVPYSGAKLMEREGYTGEEMTPTFINPSRDMSIDQLLKKGIGETDYDAVDPSDRELQYLGRDLTYLQQAIMRTQEWMCGQIITKGHVDCEVGDAANSRKVRLQFYKDTFDNAMTFTGVTWGKDGDIYGAVSDMANSIDAEYGDLDLILGANLVKEFMKNAEILDMLDVANANFGSVDPTAQTFPGVGFIGAINFSGKLLNVYTYNAKATVAGEQVSYIDPDYVVCLPREKFGATKFGAVTQMEQSDGRYHTYAADMVPRYIADAKHNQRALEMASRPLPHPYALDSWRVWKAK